MEELKPRVSFIIATYNKGDFVLDAVESILKQKYNNIEVIVVDDSSTDNTGEILQGAFKDRIIYHLNPKNMGPAFSRNIGLDYARGKYIGLLDSDDILYDENHTQIAVDIMEKDEKISLFTCDFHIIDERGRVLNKYSPLCDSVDYIGFPIVSGKRDFSALYLRGVHSCGALLRRSAVDIAGKMDENYRIAWDLEYFLRLLGKSKSCLYYYHRPLTGYRKVDNSLSTNLIKMYSEKVKIYEEVAAAYPCLKEKLGSKANKRVALQIISLSDAYKVQKKYVMAACTMIKALLRYPPSIIFYFLSFLSIFSRKYEERKLMLLKV